MNGDLVTLPTQQEVADTKTYLRQVLMAPFGQEVKLEFPSGMGYTMVQRIRVELSRIKKAVESQGKTIPYFKLRANVELNQITTQEPFRGDIVTFKRVTHSMLKDVDLSDLAKILVAEAESGSH